MPKRTRSYKAGQLERLKNPRYAAEYINAAIEAGDDAAFLLALRNVAEAQSVTAVAHEAGVSRENVYRMLSETGNPCYASLQGILGALGLRFNIQPVTQEPSEGTCSYAYERYSPLVWEVNDRPGHPYGYFSRKLGGFAKGFYSWRDSDQIDQELLASAAQAKYSGESLDLELVA